MAKKKKSLKNSNQLNKQQAAERKKAFFMRLFEILKLIGMGDYVNDFTPIAQKKIYHIHFHAIKAQMSLDSNLPVHYIKSANVVLSQLLKSQKVLLREFGVEISLFDYYTVWMTFIMLLDILKEDELKSVEVFRDKLEKYGARGFDSDEFVNEIIETNDLCKVYCEFFMNMNSSMDYWLLCGELKQNVIGDENGTFQNILVLSKVVPAIKYFVFNQNSRPAFRVGWPVINVGVHWFTLTPEQLGINTHMSKLPMEVYIQKHAINRLNERIDILPQGILQSHLACSILEPKVIQYNGKRLLEYRINMDKVGYLLLEVHNGEIILRTFLFLLNEGTPEGDKFNQLTRLCKYDSKYLILDKMSSYNSPDISQNKKIKDLLCEAGCSSIMNFYDFNPGISATKSMHFTTNLLETYLNSSMEDVPVAAY